MGEPSAHAALAASDGLSGRLDGGTHVYRLRVYYEDTDASGIVYHASYLRFAERARTEMMRRLGANHSALLAETGVAFAVRRCEIDFAQPARLDDTLDVRTRIVETGGATLIVEQVIGRAPGDGATPATADRKKTLARLVLKLACIDRSGRPVRLPGAVRAAVQSLPNRTSVS